MNERDKAAYLELVDDPDELKFVASFMEIPAKSGAMQVPLMPWPCQRRLISNMGQRNLWIKDSQCGSTSIASAIMLKRTCTTPHTTSVIMAHDEFTTQRLLHRIDVMYNSIPRGLVPELDHRSSYEKRFPDINSVIYIATARAEVAGRGEPIHNLILSEAAFYVPGARERIIIPALQRVPMDGGWVTVESTPNGEDLYFYEEVQKALQGNSPMRLQVVYWWDNPDNVLPTNTILDIPAWDRRSLDYDSKEETLVGLHQLSEDQVRWRRYKVREMGDMFFQEHLESLDTCFLLTGESYYPAEPCIRLSKGCYPAPFTGPGNSMMWEEVSERGVYFMGVDPGQGKSTETVASVWKYNVPYASENGDEASLPMFQHVASLSRLEEAADMKEQIEDLAKYYNWATVNPEANGHGQGFIREFKHYPHLYWREDIVSGQKGMQIGWLTTGRTKPYMMQVLRQQLATLETHDAALMQQIRGMREAGGKVVSAIMDDHHDAACLALVAAQGAKANPDRGFKGGSGFTSWDRR